MTRRGVLGLGALVGAGGLLGLGTAPAAAQGTIGSSSNPVDLHTTNVNVANAVEIEELASHPNRRISFSDPESDAELFHVDADDRSIVWADADTWMRDGTINDLGAIDNSSITGGNRLESLVGGNLSISDGSLYAPSGDGGGGGGSRANVVDIDDYGADPSGSDPSTGAIESAIDAASDGDVIAMTNGEYWIDSHVTTTKELVFDGTGSELRVTGIGYEDPSPTLGAINCQSPAWNGSLSTPDTTLASSANAGEQSVVLADASGFSEGDGLVLGENKAQGSSSLLWGASHRTVESDHAVIRHKSGDTLYLDRPLLYSYSPNCGAWNAGDYQAGFVNMHFTEGGGEEESERFLSFFLARNSYAKNCRVERGVSNGFQDFYGLRNRFVDCVWENPSLPQRASSHWEVFRVMGSTEISIVRPVIHRCRRGIDMYSGAGPVTILEPRVHSAYLHGVCPHSNSDYQVSCAWELIGGEISAEAEYPDHDKYDFGRCLSIHGDEPFVKVRGTRLRGVRGVGTSYGVSFGDVSIRDCTIETLPENPGTAVDLDGGTNVWFTDNHVKGDCSLENNSYLWARDNRIEGSFSASGSSPASVDGNL